MKRMNQCIKRAAALVLAAAVLLGLGIFADVHTGNLMVAEAATVKLSQKSAELVPGETLTLKVKNAGSKKVTWKSSNSKVATVSSKGKVTAKDQTGKNCTITATVGTTSLKCKVSVVDSKIYKGYWINWRNVRISGIAADGKTYVEGAWAEWLTVIVKKDGYYYYVDEAHNYDVSGYYVREKAQHYIGKTLPECLANPMQTEDGINVINFFKDVNGNPVFEEGVDLTDEEWAEKRVKELGFPQ